MAEEEHIRLREFIERILEEREHALNLTAKNLEIRLDYLNNLREEVTRDRELYMHKAVFETSHNEDVRRISALESMQSKMVGIGVALVALSGVIGFLLGHK